MELDKMKQLIALLEEFENEQESKSDADNFMNDFSKWLFIKYHPISHPSPDEEVEAELHSKETIATLIGKNFTTLNRFARQYMRQAMLATPFTSPDDFSFMLLVDRKGKITKMDTINGLYFEKATGIEIINRLIDKGLISQFHNPSDKRSKYLTLSDKGRELMKIVIQKMNEVSETVVRNLSDEERVQLLLLSDKLFRFHKEKFVH